MYYVNEYVEYSVKYVVSKIEYDRISVKQYDYVFL